MKLNYLICLSILATIGIILFQISWLKNSYQISREKIRIEVTANLEQAIKTHEEMVSKTIRREIIRIIKSKPGFYIKITNRYDGFKLGFDGPEGEIMNIGPLFNLTKEEAAQARENSYNFFIKRIGYANIEELKHIFNYIVGPHDFGPEKMDINKSFELHRDTLTLEKLIKRISQKQYANLIYNASYFGDILNIFGPQPHEYFEDDNGEIDSTTVTQSATYYKLSHGEKLDSLETYIKDKNKTDDLIYITRPLFDIDSILNNRSPVIVLTIEAPMYVILTQMLFSLIGSFLLLLLVVFCLIYMFYTILKQKKLSEIKDDFISNVSHELKTPVATTLAAVQGMQHFGVLEDKDKTNQYLATAEKEMHRLGKMIDTILSSAIYDRSDFSLNIVKFNFKEMLMEIINVQELHAKKEVKISMNYQANEEVFGDKVHLYNVFMNLIDNAIKYSNEKVAVKIECMASNDGIKILVSDNGKGVPIAYQKNIFDKFFRVPSPSDYAVKGHGLGLSYVKSIIEKHKGAIILAKSDASGSSFEINMPQ
jgi:signal transduction histidine kinase